MVRRDVLRTSNLFKGSIFKKFVICFSAPGVHAIVIYRFGMWLKEKNIFLRLILEPVYKILFYRVRSNWGIEISRGAEIGEGFYIGHYGGILIGSLVKIGKNVNISQQVVIGVAGKGDKRGSPTIGDNVYIGPGAKIFGKIYVGNNVKIGANAVIYKNIPDNAVVVLDPGFTIKSFV